MVTILAIDDKPDNLIAISALLKTCIPDCTVVTADSGAEGIEKANAELPDTILLDIKMPEMDGFEVCGELKSSEKTQHIPIIMITAVKTDTQSRIKGLALGADAFLSKPVDETELAAQVKVMLRIKQAEDHLRREKDLLVGSLVEKTQVLIDSEERYRALFEYSPVDTIVVDNGARVVMFNMAKEKSEARTPEIGDVMYKDYAGNHQINMHGELMECIESGTQKQFPDLRYKERFLHVRISPFSGGAIITCIDNTERNALQAQLQQVHKMEAVGTLAGGIAHDFNNMLGIILGNTEMAMDDLPRSYGAHEFLEEARKACMRAKDTVSQILMFSPQSDRVLKPVDIGPLVQETARMLRSSIPTTIDIRIDTGDDKAVINADLTQINQVLINLCTNASHTMKEDGGTLTISLEKIRMAGKKAGSASGSGQDTYVGLTVGDTGQGIAADIKDRIFDPYFTTKGVGEGSGMGLAVVHGIVESHGGTITVDSIVGKGTRFQVLFPEIAFTEATAEPEETENIPTGSERLLFVDDEPAMARIYQAMLERLGYTVEIKTGSVEALEAFRAHPDNYDLVITDQTMPHLTGQVMAKEIMMIRPDIPVILCTGYSDLTDEKKAKADGIQAFVMKPISMSKIAGTIRDVLDNRKRTQVTGRILVIDDEPKMRKMLRQMLEKKGHDVIEAADGNEGVRSYRENLPDIVITDLIMPDKEGVETIIELRDAFPDVKIIAISGGGKNTPESYLQSARELGAMRTFAKPINMTELTDAVDELLA
ncbi:MAG: response regulator [Desulfobacterales bacterium]